VKKGVTNRPAVDIKELSDGMLLPILRAWEELSSTCGPDDAAKFFPLIARAMMSEWVGEKRSRQEWERADIAVRRWERQKARQESQPHGSKRSPGRPKGATKNAGELVPHFLTLRRIHREQAKAAGEKPMSDTQLANIMATEIMSPKSEQLPSYSGGSFVDDDGHTVGIQIVPEPPRSHFGGSADGLKRRILASTQNRRAPKAKAVKKTPRKT
jgi:hypothetical protein